MRAKWPMLPKPKLSRHIFVLRFEHQTSIQSNGNSANTACGGGRANRRSDVNLTSPANNESIAMFT